MSAPTRENLIATMRALKVCVLMPTYNNGGTAGRVVSDILGYADDLIVVNDGSTDNTASVLKSFGDRITVVDYERNRGKGHALRTGFRKARAMGYDYVITIDADGQHYASDIPLFVKAIAEHPGALVVGARDLSGVDINGKSSFANKFSNFWFYVQTGRRLPDTQTGYRAYPLRHLHGLGLLTSRYEAELELLVFASWHGTEIVSIPISVYYPPQAERVSHFRPALDFTRISILNTVLCAGAVVYGAPLRMVRAVTHKQLFNGEFKAFTRKNGRQREAAITLGRLARSLYGISYFAFWSMCVFTPFAWLYFSIGKNSEAKKLRFHKMLRWICASLTRKFPGATATIDNSAGETFERPAVVICNHQSHLDLPMLIAAHPKLIFLTNDWVQHNSFYGRIIHNADYLPVSEGIDAIMPRLRELRDRGYSIVIFPEGTRSADCTILRFRQGAFKLARELDMDIVPMVLHGVGHYLPKDDFMFRRGRLSLTILPRVPAGSSEGTELREEASAFRKLIRKEYDRIAARVEDCSYFRSLVLYKYAWRGWSTVSRCKKTLREAATYSHLIESGSGLKRVRIINSGIGTFALLYALVNKNTEVYACESSPRDYNTATSTPGLPRNLHHLHRVWVNDYVDDNDYDLTIILGAKHPTTASRDSFIEIPLKS